MDKIKSHLLFNARQRKGILLLLLIIVVIQIAYFLVDFSVPKEKAVIEREEIFQQKIDSLKVLSTKKIAYKIVPFNPNFITDFKGYQLGMSTEEIDRLSAFRKTDKFVNSAEEFQQITNVSDSLLQKISPFFKFPDWVKKVKIVDSKNTNNNQSSANKIIVKQDINKATEADLIKINGIGEVLSKRIIEYRNKLGGFNFDNQLYEVWNLDKLMADKVLEQFKVTERPEIKKVNINTASFKEVLAVVYIDYELCKKIFDYKKEIAAYQSLEELRKINGFPLDKYERIILYLDVK
ncbi:MAG: helix-hairpin-helix domain-containing protein [Flavobacteriaceae bacterium]|nr:helix-hairpin-helix domain-containing protein [Flavobacteriaceae bacterium]